MDKKIEKQISTKQRAIESSLSEKDIYTSPKFLEHLQILADSVLLNINKSPKVYAEYAPLKDDAAYTTGEMIYINTANEVSSAYSAPESRMLTLMGILFHECAHVKYLDFNTRKDLMDNLQSGQLSGDIKPINENDETTIAEIIQAIKNPSISKLLSYIYSQISNFMSDIHDERCLSNEFHGIVEKSLIYLTEALRTTFSSFEKIIDNQQKFSKLSVILSLILQYARCGHLVIEDEEKAKDNEYFQAIEKIKPFICLGCEADGMIEQFSAINQCILALWAYIKEAINQQNNNQQSNNGDDNSQEQEKNGSSQQNSEGGSNQTNNQSDNEQSNDGGSSVSEETIDKVLEDLQKAISENVPNISANPQNRTTQKPNNECAKKSTDSRTPSISDEQAKDMVKNILQQIKSEIAKKQAEDDVEKDIENDMNVRIHAVDQTSSHKNKTVSVIYPSKISDKDITKYNNEIKDILAISRALKKKMLNELRDLQQGEVLKHRSFGRHIDASSSYRIDGKFYSTKKNPKDLPDMAIMVLLDLSGSTKGERILSERKAAMLLHDFASGLDIPIMVCGHRANGYGTGINFYPYICFDSCKKSDKYKLSQIQHDAPGNRDGMAIKIAADLLSQRTEEVKLLLILSDGQPYDRGYGGKSAEKDIQEIVKYYKRKGVETIAGAIGDDKENIQRIYKDSYLDLSDLSSLPKALVKIVKKRIL